MTRRFAILLDGGFVTRRMRGRLGRFPAPDDVLAECERIAAHAEMRRLALLRIYYYDAPPATSDVINPLSGETLSLRKTAAHSIRARFLDELELKPNVALRKGELALHGWRVRSRALEQIARSPRALVAEDLELNIEQKGVDLRIGLDIARLSLRRLVDTIVVVAGDSDFIPAFKFARREGLRVYLEDLGSKFVKPELRAHADMVLGTVLSDPEANQARVETPPS